MSFAALSFIFASTLQLVIFGFVLNIFRMRGGIVKKSVVPGPDSGVLNRLATLETSVNGLRTSFGDVIDRLEAWTKRDGQRAARAKKTELLLPLDKDLVDGQVPKAGSEVPGPAVTSIGHPPLNLSAHDRIRAALKGNNAIS